MRASTTALFLVASVTPATRVIHAQTLDVAALEAAANQELSRHRVPGLAIAIVKDDRVVYMKGFGVANVETADAMRPETLLGIGSLTKSLTSMALVSLAVAGQLRLDDPVGTYVPGLSPSIARVTAGQLLSHTAGIADHIPWPGHRDESMLAGYPRSWGAGDSAFFTEPGQIFSVSNAGYQLAGVTLEAVAKKPYADAMRAQVFEPLGMARTTLRPSDAINWQFAPGYTRGPDGGPVLNRLSTFPPFWPSGGVFSNVRDLSRFMIAFLNDGQLDGKQVLDPKVIAAMTTPRAKVPTNPTGAYGYGLFLDTIRGVRIWQHGGQRIGYGATIRMAPDYRVGVVILANAYGAEMPLTAMKALELMVPLKPAERAAPGVALTATPDDLRRHPGVYRNFNNAIEILASDGQLFVKRDGRTRPLVKRTDVRFDSDSLGWYVFTPAAGDRTRYVSAGNQSYGRVSVPPRP
jgi:CubicO group peptidase (beta-lactamase class C family)